MRTSGEHREPLERTHALLLQMAVRVERQLEDAVAYLGSGSPPLIDRILRHADTIDGLERAVDALAGRAIGRRTPAPADPRLPLAFIKTATELERIGGEAKEIALRAKGISDHCWPARPREVAGAGGLALRLVRHATKALELLDPGPVGEAAARAAELDASLREVLREQIGYMIEDPRTLSGCLDMLGVARSFERIGDHATNILENIESAMAGRTAQRRDPATS